MSYQVGQQLWCSYSQIRSTPEYVSITKVGRKWLELSNRYRAEKETLKLDGGAYSSPGQCYISKEEFDNVVFLNDKWNEFQRLIRNGYARPKHLTADMIDGMMSMIKNTPDT